MACFQETAFSLINLVCIKFYVRKFRQDCCFNLCTIEILKYSKNFEKNKRARRIVLFISSLRFCQSNRGFHHIKKTLFLQFKAKIYLQNDCLRNQKREGTEDSEAEINQPGKVSMCYLDRGRSTRDSFSRKNFYKISYDCSTKAQNQSLVPKL